MLKKIIVWVNFLLSVPFLIYILSILMSGENVGDNIYVPLLAVFWAIVGVTLLIELYGENRRLKKWSGILLLIFLVLGVTEILLALFSTVFERFPLELFSALTGVFFTLVFLIYIRTRQKVDLFIPLLILLSFLGIFFKSKHWPGSGPLLVLGWAMPAILYFFIFYKRITEYDSRTNSFLNFFNKLVSGTLTICFLGATFKIMHWPGGSTLYIMSMPSFIIAALCVVFLLPSSNFIEWTKTHKRMFYQAILIPMMYMAIMTSLGTVFPETFQKYIFGRTYGTMGTTGSYYLYKYDIPVKDGL